MVIEIINTFFQVYMVLLLARIIGSWFPDFQQHKIMRFIGFYTDPYLNFFRRIIPPFGMIDFSPIIAFFSLELIRMAVFKIIYVLFG